MITLLLPVGGIFILAMMILIICIARARDGYEDASGFHSNKECRPVQNSRKVARRKDRSPKLAPNLHSPVM